MTGCPTGSGCRSHCSDRPWVASACRGGVRVVMRVSAAVRELRAQRGATVSSAPTAAIGAIQRVRAGEGVPLLDDVPPGHVALFRELASESPDNSVCCLTRCGGAGLFKKRRSRCQGWSTKSSCRNRCPVDSRDELDTRHRAQPVVTDDAKSRATRWTRLRVVDHTAAISPCPDIGDSWPDEGGAARRSVGSMAVGQRPQLTHFRKVRGYARGHRGVGDS
jgi:hypothetical protein